MKHSIDNLRPILAVVSLAGVMLLAIATLTLSACNTTEGFGKDVKSAGQGIENTASDAKK